MKKYLPALILIFAATMLLSCAHEKCCTIPDQKNSAYALKNNVDWHAPVQLSKILTNGDSVALTARVGEELLYVTLKKIGAVYQVATATYYITVGQDAVVSRYELDTTQANTFMASVDTGQKLGGMFTFYFKQVYDNTPGTHPSTISFKGGIFKVDW